MKSISIKSEITGTVCSIVAAVGQQVEEDDIIVLIESMKMEVPAQAPCAGTITKILPQEGDLINEDDVIAIIEAS